MPASRRRHTAAALNKPTTPNPAAGRAIAGRKPEEKMPGGWIAMIVLALLLAAALFGAYEGWVAHSGNVEVPEWGYVFLAVGLVFGLLLGGGLMALIFYSSRAGYDDPAVTKQNDDGDAPRS
jgi:hypothetical protein